MRLIDTPNRAEYELRLQRLQQVLRRENPHWKHMQVVGRDTMPDTVTSTHWALHLRDNHDES